MQRSTRQRSVIRAVMEHAHRPLSAREVLAEGRRDIANLGLATVYRALRSLVDEGEVTAVQLAGDVPRYALARESHAHHFRCGQCKRVFDLDEFPGKLSTLAPPGFEVLKEEITLHGFCLDCRAVPPRSAHS